jgi:predicted nucleic acid-binding protein
VENLARIAALRRSVAVLPLSDSIVDLYGATRASLESRGVTKSDFDLLIACCAIDQDALLITNDGGLLDGTITSLRAENWLA